MKNEISTAIMLFVFGGIMAATGDTLYWWVKMLGIVAIIMGCISILVGVAVWYDKKTKLPVK